jgi:hypothetical protein
MIIGIGGKMCSGKTLVTKYLYNNLNCDVFNFADKLKSVTSDLLGVVKKDRSLLQDVGIKMREIDKNVWVDYVFRQFDSDIIESLDEHYVIGDVRFNNEVDAVHTNKGITIYIDRPFESRLFVYKSLYGMMPTNEQLEHESELISSNLFTYTINNDSDEGKLYTDIDNIIEFEINRRGIK